MLSLTFSTNSPPHQLIAFGFAKAVEAARQACLAACRRSGPIRRAARGTMLGPIDDLDPRT